MMIPGIIAGAILGVASPPGAPLTGYYYNDNYTEQAYVVPSSVTDLITIEVEPSASPRTFVVCASTSWLNNGVRGMVGAITLDGATVAPANSSTASRRFSNVSSGTVAHHIELSGIVVTVPGDNIRHSIGLAVALDGSAGSVTLNGQMIRAIDLSVVSAYHSATYAEASSGSIPTSTSNFHSVTIPASGSPRTFLVMGTLGWIDATSGIRSCVRMDNTAIAPTSTGENVGLNNFQDGTGAKFNPFAGIFVTVPGDGAAHTISLAGEAQASVAAVTWTCRSIVAIDVTSLVIEHSESYSGVSSGTLPSTLTEFYTLTIPADTEDRLFGVDAMLGWVQGNTSTGVDACLTLDGVPVIPADGSTQAKIMGASRTGDGGQFQIFCGGQIMVPGDGEDHTIGIAGMYSVGDTAVTWSVRSISAIHVGNGYAEDQDTLANLRGTGSFSVGNSLGLTLTPSPASNTAQGDYMLMVCCCSAGNSNSTPTGWTAVPNCDQAGTDRRIQIFQKVAGASEGAASVTRDGGDGSAVIVSFKNIDTANPINDSDGTTGNGTAPSCDTTADNCMVVVAAGTATDANGPPFNSWTNSNLLSFREAQNQSSSAGAGVGSGVACGRKGTAGSTGAATYGGQTGNCGICTIALNPAP